MLVVDFNALQAIDFLHFVDQVLLKLLGTADIEHLMRNDRPFGQLLALLHEVALEDDDVLRERNEVLFLGAGVGIRDDQPALAAHGAADIDNPVDLGDLGSVLRMAGLEKLGHARKTTGDVLGLGDLARSLGKVRARERPSGLPLRDVSAGGDGVARDDLLLFSDENDLRMKVLLVLDDDRALLAGGLVDFLATW